MSYRVDAVAKLPQQCTANVSEEQHIATSAGVDNLEVVVHENAKQQLTFVQGMCKSFGTQINEMEAAIQQQNSASTEIVQRMQHFERRRRHACK